jgi:L-alanine-DL-glutamate epimerase-like enolase superfamily enzyme
MKITLTATPARLLFRYPFRIAHGERTFTDVVFLQAECLGARGFGEATLPPYLGISVADVLDFFRNPFIQNLDTDMMPDEIFREADRLVAGLMPAKAALDMALWSLHAAMRGQSMNELFLIKENRKVPHTYTIGVSGKSEFAEKLNFGIANGFNFFKLKLDGIHDHEMLDHYAANSRLPFAVDVNQGWNSLDYAFGLAEKLKAMDCVLIEQPFHKNDREMSLELKKNCAIPVIADEACQRLTDIDSMHGIFDGINIKIQKCGGLSEAVLMLRRARELDMKVLIGCMSESSVGCNAAEILAPACDWADLDGPWLIRNDAELMEQLGYKKSL